MSTIQAYSKSIGREDSEHETKDEHERLLKEEELKTWLSLAKTKELLLFLAKRELELLNSARNFSKVSLKNDNTDKQLLKSIAIREIIDYIIENKIPGKE